MLAWVVDHANFVYLILGVIALGLGASWYLNRRNRQLYLLGIVLALIAILWFMTRLVSTDRKQLEANLWAMARAVLDRKPDDLTRHWAKDLSVQNLNREELAQVAARTATQAKVDSINLWEFDVKSVTGDKAEIWFRCVANAEGGAKFLALCKAHFVKEGADWKLQRAAFFQPIANTDQEIQVPLR